MSLTLAEARTIIEAGLARARELNQRVAIAVVDEAGNLISCDKMDGAPPLRDRFATGKAFAALIMRRSTADMVRMHDERPSGFFSALNMFPQQMYLVEGGFPLQVDGAYVGGVGCAGGHAGIDEKVCEAGVTAWEQARAGQ